MVSRKKYIQLGEGLLPREQHWLEHSIQAVLTPVLPPEQFVADLERELIQESQRQVSATQDTARGWRVASWIGGGLLSIAGGILVWALLRQKARQGSAAAGASPRRRARFGTPELAGATPAIAG
ncbi:MAG TPA: hypothetical protein PLJ78_10910 [Anaerolineae bacterium]|nr:hypothetical protein [Anaerolineae bacterium]HQK14437.1 hypothetical protein [Anaerolineae bacterium]